MKKYKSRFKHYSEARRNPDMNPHIGAWDYLDKYKDDPDVYISFTEIDKIGINPRSKYNTPVGVYTYPLKEFVKNYMSNTSEDRYRRTVGSYAPFAGNAKYINFIRVKDKSNFINDMYSDYGSNNYDRDIKILKKLYQPNLNKEQFSYFINEIDSIFFRAKRKNYTDDLDTLYKFLETSLKRYKITLGDKGFQELQGLVQEYYLNEDETIFYNIFKTYTWEVFVQDAIYDSKERNPIMIMWNITRLLAEKLSANAKQASTKWNLILSKDLGYSGFADKSGKGYIHPSEPMQAVFFNTRAFDVITRVENVPAKKVLGLNTPKDIIEHQIMVLKLNTDYTINSDNSVDFVGSIGLDKRKLEKIPFKFGLVTGHFFCFMNKLTSLKNSPDQVWKDFVCDRNPNLKSLQYLPKSIGGDLRVDYHMAKLYSEDDIRKMSNIKGKIEFGSVPYEHIPTKDKKK